MLALTKEPHHRRLLWILIAIGLLVATYLLVSLGVRGGWVDIDEHHIRYDLRYAPMADWLCRIGYGLATIVAPFCCRRPRVWVLGIGLAAAYGASWAWFQHAVISVWCFFSAGLSLLILWVLADPESRPDHHRS